MNSRLSRAFFLRKATIVAPDLLGKVLCLLKDGKISKWRIVETEAYCGVIDKAAHSYQGRRTKRTEAMYLEGGHLYIYLIYGMYYMLNIVVNQKEIPEGVLIRAVEPFEQEEKTNTNGPGKLCQTLGINLEYNRLDLCSNENVFLVDGSSPQEIVITKRVNIDYAMEDKDWLWRYYIAESPYVSLRVKNSD